MSAVLSRGFLLCCLFVSPVALGATFPNRTVTIVVTSAAGALTAGALTWLLLTARHDLEPPGS